jgi:hypothetical protein
MQLRYLQTVSPAADAVSKVAHLAWAPDGCGAGCACASRCAPSCACWHGPHECLHLQQGPEAAPDPSGCSRAQAKGQTPSP